MSEKQAQYGYKGKSIKETHAPMEEFSVDKCPDCNSEKIFKLKWIPYNEQTYRCKKCKSTWDKNRCHSILKMLWGFALSGVNNKG